MDLNDNQFQSFNEIVTALEQFHTELKNRTYVGGSNSLAEAVLQTAPIVSLEQYTDAAFTVALETTQSRWKEFVDWLFKVVRDLLAGAVMWFKSKFGATAEASHDRLDAAIDKVSEVHEAVAADPDLLKSMAGTPPQDETLEQKLESFKRSVSTGFGAGIVKLGFKEDLWINLISTHIKMCVHITKEITHSDDILSAIQTQRQSLKGQIARDVEKANAARNALEKALGLPQSRAKTLTECIQANTRLMTEIYNSEDIRSNPDHLLSNIPSVAKLMVNMDSTTYRETAQRDILNSTERLDEVEAGIARVEKQLTSDEAIARQEESAELRAWVAELRAAIAGLQTASKFHIRYVNAHARMVETFTAYYLDVAKLQASKLSANALVAFNKNLNKENKS